MSTPSGQEEITTPTGHRHAQTNDCDEKNHIHTQVEKLPAAPRQSASANVKAPGNKAGNDEGYNGIGGGDNIGYVPETLCHLASAKTKGAGVSDKNVVPLDADITPGTGNGKSTHESDEPKAIVNKGKGPARRSNVRASQTNFVGGNTIVL